MDPPITLSPSFLLTARDSPVTIASLILEEPWMILPSTGILSPAATRTTSPIITSVSSFVTNDPSSCWTFASLGNSAAIFSSAFPALPTAFISIQCPSNIITIRLASSQKKSITWCELCNNTLLMNA